MKSLLSIATGAMIAVACLCSCGGGDKAQTTATQEVNRMSLTKQDTVTVTGLVSDFMERIVNHDKDAAAAMLYTVDFDDSDREPYPIPDMQREQLDQMLSLPVTSYEIAEYAFESADQNEVRCRVRINDRFTTNWYFKPVRYLGNWYLCIKDSSEGDRSLNTEQAEIAR